MLKNELTTRIKRIVYYRVIMSDAQWKQYENLHIFAKDWRKYSQVSQPRNKESFRNDMQFMEYVDLKYTDPINHKPVIIYLFSPESKFAKKSPELKKLLNRLRKPTKVIIVTHEPLKIHSVRAINDQAFNHLDVSVYRHENFNIVTPKGPLCYPHRIMRHTEVNKLLNDDLCCYLVNLPKIREDDAQCIWIGAECGDVVEIKPLSSIAMESVQYRLVIAKHGRVVSLQNYQKSKKSQEDDAGEEEEEPGDVDDVGMFREDMKNNEYGSDSE
jgi:DNA-directed RNA polymerase subunit H (RpoH/RPB5)